MKEPIIWPALMLTLTVPVFTVWYAVCALLVRPFGIRVPVLIWNKGYRKAIGKLSRIQYAVLLGALTLGVGTQLLLVLFRYLEHLFRLGDPVPENLGYLAVQTVGFMVVQGILWGCFVWKNSSLNSDPFSGNDTLSINPKSGS